MFVIINYLRHFLLYNCFYFIRIIGGGDGIDPSWKSASQVSGLNSYAQIHYTHKHTHIGTYAHSIAYIQNFLLSVKMKLFVLCGNQ